MSALSTRAPQTLRTAFAIRPSIFARFASAAAAGGAATVAVEAAGEEVPPDFPRVGFGAGMVLWRSAVYQGETSAASIALVAKRPDQMGRSITFPALVETYALLALLAAIMLIIWLTSPGLTLPEALPAVESVGG